MANFLCSFVLGIVFCSSWASALDNHVVYPGEGACSDPPCFTLQYYLVNGSSYFTNHSIFQFLPGNHFLNTTLDLNNLDNVTLKAVGTGAEIILSSQGTLACTDSQRISLIGLTIRCNNFQNAYFEQTSMIFFDSHLLVISHSVFEMKQSKHLRFYGCRANISNCSFSYGTVDIVSSIVNFTNTLFHKRFAPPHGSAIKCVSAHVEFHGSLSVTDNKDVGLHATDSLIMTLGLASFINNGPGRAVSLFNSIFVATGELNFVGNRGFDGGAIRFVSSSLRLKPPVNISFVNNSASRLGGALYVVDSDLTYFAACRLSYLPDEPCFMEVDSHSNSTDGIHIEFRDNTAPSGSLLYGGDLRSCIVQSNGILQDITGYQFLKNVSTISQNETISSLVLNLSTCASGYPDYGQRSLFYTKIPGEKFNVSIAAIGQFNSTTADVGIRLAYSSNDRLALLSNNSLTVGCNNVTLQVLSYLDNPNYGVWNIYPYGFSTGYINITIDLKKCPNGFTLIVDTCACEKRLQELDHVDCNVQSKLIENGGKYWISPNYNNGSYIGFLLYDNCPSGYCKYNNRTNPSRINFSSIDGSNSQCVDHRKGILCGACEEGYSLTLSSLECAKCTNKFLGLILLFAVAGVGLIALLLALHMTVASGTLNGIILYANIVNVHVDLFMLKGDLKINPLAIVTSWLNLDFGIPLCLYDGLDLYQYSWLQYVFPLYLWFLTGCIIIGCKYFASMRRLLGSNPVAVLATVILMSFTKLLHTAVDGLTYAELKNSNETANFVWYSDGNIEYLENWNHIVLASTGIFVVLFILIPYTIFLTFGYRLQAYSDRKCFHWLNKTTPLLDAYYAPYKKETRYWPGLMLLMRIGLFLSYILCDDNMMIVISVIFLASITSHLKLYTSTYLDVLEASFALNLCVLCAGTYHVRLYQGNQYILSSVCVGIALLELCGIIIFHTCKRFNCVKLFTRLHCVKFILKKCHFSHKEAFGKEVVPVLNHSYIDYREPILNTDNRSSFPHYSS